MLEYKIFRAPDG
ncbi:hypothetical protein YPPY98_0804, partial [Yersinia pestis PY-98]